MEEDTRGIRCSFCGELADYVVGTSRSCTCSGCLQNAVAAMTRKKPTNGFLFVEKRSD